MKRRELLEAIKAHGAVFVREGGEHTVYRNPRTGREFTVPRHREISPGVSRQVLKDARA